MVLHRSAARFQRRKTSWGLQRKASQKHSIWTGPGWAGLVKDSTVVGIFWKWGRGEAEAWMWRNLTGMDANLMKWHGDHWDSGRVCVEEEEWGSSHAQWCSRNDRTPKLWFWNTALSASAEWCVTGRALLLEGGNLLNFPATHCVILGSLMALTLD